MKELMEQPQKIVVVGDAFVSPDTMVQALKDSLICCGEIQKFFWGSYDKQEFTYHQLQIERGGPEAVPYAEGLEKAIEDADILMVHFNPLPGKLIRQGKKLKLILTCRGGTEHIDLHAAGEIGIPVLNVIRNAEPVADFTLGMILALTRNIALSYMRLKEGEWKKNFYNSEFITTLDGQLVGLAGLGNVGIALARRLKALDVPMIVYDPYLSERRLEENGLTGTEVVPSIEELFERADIISLHLRLTSETEHIVDQHLFSRMKKTAYFINTARGGLVDQQALIAALENRCIAGAALDVYDMEPLALDSPLLQMDQVLLTPHIAGTTVDAIPRSPFLLMKETDRFLKKGITERIVNKELIRERI